MSRAPRTFAIGQIAVTGSTAAEAKANAITAAAAALSGTFDSFTVTDRGRILTLWREPNGFCYIIRDASQLVIDGTRDGCLTMLPPVSRESAVSSACFDFAQSTYPAFAEIPAAIVGRISPNARNDLRDWYHWQDAYKAARASGQSDEQARAAAWSVGPAH